MSSSNSNSASTRTDNQQTRTRILIVDSQSLSSELIKSQLKPEPYIQVIGSVHTELATFEVIKNFLPNIVLIDFDVPEINGFALIKKIEDNFPVVRTIVFTNSHHLGEINQALSLGASGFLIKNSPAEEVKNVLNTIIFDRSEDTKLQLPIPIDPIESVAISKYKYVQNYETVEEVREFLDRVTSEKADQTKLQPAITTSSANTELKPSITTNSTNTKLQSSTPISSTNTKLQPAISTSSSNTELKPSTPTSSTNTELKLSITTSSTNTKLQSSTPISSSNTELKPSTPTSSTNTKLEPSIATSSTNTKLKSSTPTNSTHTKRQPSITTSSSNTELKPSAFVSSSNTELKPPTSVNSIIEVGISRDEDDLGSSQNNSAIVKATPAELPVAVTEQEDWSAATKDLMDALPTVWTRGLLYFLVVSTAILVPWSVLTKVDQTGTARGRLEPKNKVIQLDAPVAAKIKNINVKEGDKVKKGAILAELGSETVSSELEQLKDKRSGLMQRLTQLELMQTQARTTINTKNDENQSRMLEKQSQVAQAQQNFDTLKAVYESQKNEKLAQIEQAKQEIESSIAARKQSELALVGAQEKSKRYEEAYKEGVIAQDRFLDIQQQAKENQEGLTQATSAVEQARSRLIEQQSGYENLTKNSEAEIQQAALRVDEQENSDRTLTASGKLEKLQAEEQLQDLKSQIATVNTEVAQTNKQIESSQFELKQRQILAPADGIVFHIPARGGGSVVQPGEKMIEIAPQNSALILKAQIPPTDSGFLTKGMPVKVKFDAYPFQDYGVSEGELVSISPDSQVTETPQGQQETYELKVELDRPYILDGAKQIKLTPGQTATAEVIIRQRRVIDFFLDPFRKLQEDGVKL